MKVSGIIAEFNPLHKGHEYIIRETRRRTGCESLCIAMSGNFVQRGEPAILDKWSRCLAALEAGADLVIEIPTIYCLSDASGFAGAGVKLLEALDPGVDICCGSESGDAKLLAYLAGLIKDNDEIIKSRIKEEIKKGTSYPAARERAVMDTSDVKALDDESKDRIIKLLSSPNDILALEYMMASSTSNIICIPRVGAAYDEEIKEKAEYQSALGIRNLLKDNRIDISLACISEYVPDITLRLLEDNPLCHPDEFIEILRYAVMSKSAEEIEHCPSAGEGLGYLIKEAVRKYDNWEDIIMACKSKRYTYTRISRLCMQIILGIQRDIIKDTGPGYIRVLGANENGRRLLSSIKRAEKSTIPVITNINKEAYKMSEEAKEMLELDVKSQDVYNLVLGRNIEESSDHTKTPILF